VTTSATPEQVKEVFGGQVYETGIKHGTVTVVIDHMPIEVTTYRIEKGYSDGRHPDKVEFTRSLEEDLARRDFTINALAYRQKAGLVDYFDGQKHISSKKICTVGSPTDRFGEDALRILRAVRFASTLGFDIEKSTADAMEECKGLLGKISKERIAVELTKMLCGDDVRNVLVKYTDILGEVIPELLAMKGFSQRNPHHIYDVLIHTAVAVENVEKIPYLRWAVLLHDVGKPATFSIDELGVGHFYGHAGISADMTRTILRRLKMDNDTVSRVVSLVKYHDMQIELTDRAVKRAMNKLGEEMFFDLIKVKRADNMGQSMEYRDRQGYYDNLENIARGILDAKECFSLKDLAVKGGDLIDIGITEGKIIGEALALLLEDVLEGKIPNEKEELLKRVKLWNKK
ncbi:MAG TPA: HD domain-containing protein, partial [Anaerovoracaceae bacterium]|nr:HD domain-containing protein [Anaerovoracaceae bacterium]